jgi:hypothetical protein
MMVHIHCSTLMLFMPANIFCNLLYFGYVLDVGSEPPRTVIRVLFNPKLMKFGSFADIKLYESSAMLVLTSMIC